MTRLTTLLLLALVLVLSACGGDDKASSDSAKAASATPAAAGSGQGDIGDATTADADEGGAEQESAPDTSALDDLPEEGVGSGQTTCPAPPEEVTAENLDAARASVLCLVNAERTGRGLKALKSNPKLAKAANTKAADMVKRRYFAHDLPDGRKFTAVIKAAGYLSGARKWSVGENLGWGSGAKGAPAGMIDAWLASPPHKANMLSRVWTEMGVGVSMGSPTGGDGATWANEFGKR